MRPSLVALTCVFTLGAVLPATTQPANAQSSLFEVIFGQKNRGARHRKREIEKLRARQAAQAAQPAPKVRGPRFYTYKPDLLKSVSLASLAVVEEITPETVDESAITSSVEVVSADPTVSVALPPVEPAAEIAPKDAAFDAARQYLKDARITALPEVGKALIEYYSENPAFIWVSEGAVNERAQQAIAAMAKAEDYGLTPSDYEVTLPAQASDDGVQEDAARSLVLFEMNMSAKALGYVLDATRGRIDPNRLSGYHDFKRKKVDLVSALGNLAATADTGVYLSGSNPGNRQFKALTAELAQLRTADAENNIEIADGTFLKPGVTNPELRNVVAAIRKKGSDELIVNHGITLVEFKNGESNAYSPELVALVKDFQRENKLSADGIVGKNTIRKMTDMSNASKIDMVVLAMERLRWLPRNLGSRHVFINQPAYNAAYINNDKEAISMRVVVGKKSNQTSFFQDEIERIEYNPYWGVPGSIIVNEMVPKLRQDPSYLDRLGYELTDRRGRRVSSRNINWYGVGPNSIPVDVRQPPGKKNALGELKILFPNKHAIYMHDTPSKNLFDRDSRALSHGCVRLHDPRGMAAAVLGSTREHVAQQIAQGRNLAEPVPGNIPVYVSYFTAWPKEDGTIGYYADMYDRDKRLNDAIARTEKTRSAKG